MIKAIISLLLLFNVTTSFAQNSEDLKGFEDAYNSAFYKKDYNYSFEVLKSMHQYVAKNDSANVYKFTRVIDLTKKLIETESINPDSSIEADIMYVCLKTLLLPMYYNNRGWAKIINSDFSGAIQDYSQCLKINSEYSVAYLSRGYAKIKIGDEIGGCLDFSKAGELGEQNAYNLIRKYCN